jgi:GNAT superfamily N-acetyltransferase
MHISTDKSELDIPLIHRYLATESYWAEGIRLELLQRSIEHSLCFGGYVDGAQVAFARVVTDYATFAHMKDVFVLPAHRGKGYGRAIVEAVMAYPDLAAVGFTLATHDAHSLYARHGFILHPHPERSMIRLGSFLPA